MTCASWILVELWEVGLRAVAVAAAWAVPAAAHMRARGRQPSCPHCACNSNRPAPVRLDVLPVGRVALRPHGLCEGGGDDSTSLLPRQQQQQVHAVLPPWHGGSCSPRLALAHAVIFGPRGERAPRRQFDSLDSKAIAHASCASCYRSTGPGASRSVGRERRYCMCGAAMLDHRHTCGSGQQVWRAVLDHERCATSSVSAWLALAVLMRSTRLQPRFGPRAAADLTPRPGHIPQARKHRALRHHEYAGASDACT